MKTSYDMIEVIGLAVLTVAAGTFAFFMIKDPEAAFGLLGKLI